MKEKRINLRLDDNLYSEVSTVADRFGLNKSEVARLALTGDLAKLNHAPINKLGSEARKQLIENSQAIFNQLNHLGRINSGIANNINQMTRRANTNDNVVIDEEYLNQFSENISVLMAMTQELKDEVSTLWRHLV